MTYVYDALLFLHFLGLAMLVGGFLAQMRATPRVVTQWMRDGVLTQLVTGLALAGMAGSHVGTDDDLNTAAVAVKLVIALIVAVICLWGMRQEPEKQQPAWAAAGALAIVNMLVAVFWLG